MTRIPSPIIGSVLIVSLAFSSCAPTADGQRTQAEGAGVGAVLGAIALGGLAAATGSSNVGEMAALGAGLGAAAGFSYGTEVAKKKKAFKDQESFLAAQIAEAEAYNRDAVAYNKKLSGQVSSLEAKVKALPPGSKQPKEIQSERKGLLTDLKNRKKDVDGKLEFNKAVLADHEKSGGSQGSARYKKLKSEMATMEKHKAEIERAEQRLASTETRYGS